MHLRFLLTPVYSQPLKRSNKSFIIVYNELICTLSPREQRGTLTQTHTHADSLSALICLLNEGKVWTDGFGEHLDNTQTSAHIP